MPDPETLPEALTTQAGVLAVEQLRQHGQTAGEVRRRVSGRDAVRMMRGVYAFGTPDPGAHQALWAAHLHLGPESVAILRSALNVHAIAGVVGHGAPQFALPPGLERRQRPGVDTHFWTFADDDVVMVDGIPTTSVTRTLADALRLLPRMQAVSCVDSALNLGLVDERALDGLRQPMARKRNCVSGRRRLAEAKIGAQSPLETRVRLRASDAGLVPDALQVPVRTRAGFLLGYGDLGYRLPDGSWLIVEADGRSIHERPEALLNDRHRQNAFQSADVAGIVRFTWEDTLVAATIPTMLSPVLTRAGWRPTRRP